MPQFFLNKKLIILLISIIFLVSLIGFSLRERDELSWPEQFMKDSAGFVQTIFHKPASAIAGFFENLSDLRNTYEENKNKYSSIWEGWNDQGIKNYETFANILKAYILGENVEKNKQELLKIDFNIIVKK